MKNIINITVEQFRSGEIWKRLWKHGTFKDESFKKWKEEVRKPLPREDIPAIILGLMISIAVIVLLKYFYNGQDFTRVLIVTLALYYSIHWLVDFVLGLRKKKK